MKPYISVNTFYLVCLSQIEPSVHHARFSPALCSPLLQSYNLYYLFKLKGLCNNPYKYYILAKVHDYIILYEIKNIRFFLPVAMMGWQAASQNCNSVDKFSNYPVFVYYACPEEIQCLPSQVPASQASNLLP